jgi:hypothetical protein
MKNGEWLSQLSKDTGLPYYQEHRIFGDKSGALIGTSDGYVVAVGLGKAEGRHAAVKMLLRYAKSQDPGAVKQVLGPAKGKFELATDAGTATLVRTYSFAKPDTSEIAERLRELLTALPTAASPISRKCEECGKSEPQIVLLNNVPVHYCSSCQVQLGQKLDAAAIEYEKLETNLPLGLLYGAAAALLGSIAWAGAAYLVHRIFLWGAIGIGLLVGKAVMKGTGKVTWTVRIVIGVLTAASVAFGDSLFYALLVMKESRLAFLPALKAVLLSFWKLETTSDSGFISILFGLIGAGISVYRTRKPAFKARFVPLGSPAITLSSVATK